MAPKLTYPCMYNVYQLMIQLPNFAQSLAENVWKDSKEHLFSLLLAVFSLIRYPGKLRKCDYFYRQGSQTWSSFF